MKLFRGTQPSPLSRKIALTLAVIILSQVAFPTAAFALTSGPSAPEYSSFEPVSTTSMVNEFSGDFTYNIPVINIPGAAGGGYAMSLSYHSGESVESEASWVGYGWTLNPGAINRGKRGFADDSKNTIEYYNDVPSNWTASIGASAGNFELFSSTIPISVNGSIRYNNYKGFGYTAGAGVSIRQGLVTLGYSVSDGTGSFSAQVNPGALLKKQKDTKENHEKAIAYKKADAKGKEEMLNGAKKPLPPSGSKQAKKDKREKQAAKIASFLMGRAHDYGMYALSDQQHPTTVTPYSGGSFNASLNIQQNPTPFEAGTQIGYFGNFNIQTNVGLVMRTGYGYMYSDEAYADQEGVMDYYSEKESTYNKRDRYLSIPFSNADAFSVSGEGVGGAFRLYNRNSGYFRPHWVVSNMTIGQVSGDASLGLENGGGFSVGLGEQVLAVNGDGWGLAGPGNAQDYKFLGNGGADEACFFRFNEDLGGAVDYDPNNKLVSASIAVDFDFPGLKTCKPIMNTSDVNTSLQSTINMGNGEKSRSGRSSYIGYHLNKEIGHIDYFAGTTHSKQMAYAYEKGDDYVAGAGAYSLVDRSDGNQVGEIATINEEGNQYVYGLPVYVNKETNLQYDLQGIGPNDVSNNFVAYKDLAHIPYKMKVGEVDRGHYANTYLLTQITTPDYVDRTLDGPTTDDFGGYTRFQYTQLYNALSNPYHFRTPFNGLNYNKGEMTDPSDDMGSYSSGDKDIYYLNQIVTKTHIAKFITSPRTDGVEAKNDAAAAVSNTAIGSKTLKKLDAIELWTNNNGLPGVLVKKVVFKYDYSLCQNLPNTTSTTVGRKGKLTLREVSFEYDGIVSAKISPYKFSYNYPTVTYPAPYSSFLTGYTGLTENPPYSPFAIDAWGNYQDANDGAARFAKMKTSVNQAVAANLTNPPPPATFDPAAWQLKVITLPSGGEIHVEYEQDDYLFVQNRRAMALVSMGIPSLLDVATSDPSVTVDVPDPLSPDTPYPGSYVLNIEEIGLNPGSSSEKQDLVNLMNQYLSDDKVYFKFLYALIGSAPDIGKCNSDYISGYLNFRKAYVSNTGKVIIQVGVPGSSDYVFPRQVCLDKVKKEKAGKLNEFGNCDASVAGVEQAGTVGQTMDNLLQFLGHLFFQDASSCLELNSSGLSYFKIPVLKPKKGGGLRVKRILMYDANGIDAGVPALYGTEYFYQTENGESSGVTTNEPSALREENALISFLPKRAEQDFLSKIVSGSDQTQFEGPIGESLLPSGAVGYSRVVAKNIHSGKTNTGFAVSEFYTAKDYPYDMTYPGGMNGVSSTVVDKQTDWMNLPAIIVNYAVSNVWAAQGYRFVLNTMHGQPKLTASYAGDYAGGSLSTFYQSSSTEYQYVQPGEGVSVQTPDGGVTTAYPGKDMEVTFEMKQVADITADASVELDFGVGMAGIIPLPEATLMPLVNYNESILCTHVTSKVIRFPVIQKAVISTQNGIKHKTENLVYSAYTGKPLITKTTDGYDGLNLPSDNPHNGIYTSYSIPAYSQYSEMGQKAINERAFLVSGTDFPTTTTFQGGPNYAIVFPTGNDPLVCDAMKSFCRGDLIRINFGSNPQFFHVDGFTNNTINLQLANILATPTFSGTISSIEIVRSGRTNQLTDAAGGYVTYGNSTVTGASIADLASKNAFVFLLNMGLNALIDGASSYPPISTGRTCIVAPEGSMITLSHNSETDQFDVAVGTTTTRPCISHLPYSGTGEFFIDPNTGQLKYRTYSAACFSYDVPCIVFCNGMNPATVSKVISSSATIYDFLWPYDATKYTPFATSGNNDYETGIKGKWRPKENYVYKTSVVGGAIEDNVSIHERNYKDAGTYLMTMFNWKTPSLNANTPWTRTSTVNMYSPNGEALEESDAINIPSAAKFGYKSMLPYLVAGNTTYPNVMFESFENLYSGNRLEDGVTVTSSLVVHSTAHSGKASCQLSASDVFRLNPVTINAQLSNPGLSLKVWVKDPSHAAISVKGILDASTPIPLNFKKIAQTGEWSLYEAVAKGMTPSFVYTPQLQSNVSTGIWIDDVRLQPLDAKMSAYVYDPQTLRLLTSFDDQHFGLYYQYNQEGKLVRKLIETEKGMKTVSETQYHTPMVTPGTY
jgi:hypothetical protein